MPALSGAACAGLQTAFLRDISAVCRQVDARLYVAHTAGQGWEVLRDIFPTAAGFFVQEGDGLGARMSNALDRVLALGHDGCVLIGSDLPLLTPAHLESAFRALAAADVTLGPTPDGGYYLVGLKRPCPALFSGKAYGTGQVWRDALAALKAAGVSFIPAPPCADVDTPEDLAALRRALHGKNSHTARWLEEHLGGTP